uniref:Tetraspanin-8-like n=1 Tax=Scleropages formosus TaxID=113540 RepID=A0A8C9VJ21_SCLFO
MVQENTCLRRLSIGFSAILGLLGAILVSLGALVHAHEKEVEQINEQLDAEFKSMKTLNSAPDEIQENFRKIQTGFECCGYFGYQDWVDEIPESCKCPSLDLAKSICQTVKTKKKTYSYGFQEKYVEVQVYKEPCGPAISQYMASGVNAVFGFASTFLVVMIVSALLSIGLYLSIGQQDNTTAVSSEDPRLSLKFCNNDIITA